MPLISFPYLIRRVMLPAITAGCFIALLYTSLLSSYLFNMDKLTEDQNVIQKTGLISSALPDPFDKNGVFHTSHCSMKDEIPDINGNIDWHDYKMIRGEMLRTGIGEQGRPVTVLGDKDNIDKLFQENGFSGYASDMISIARSVGDIRHPQCKSQRYAAKLPTVSLVIPFFEEHNSTLIRTVISALNRSPPELIKEVILVDDASSQKSFLKNQLEDFVNRVFPNRIVKILRNKQREGLIRTRLVGAKAATGDVLVFLDSHVECSTNWLPPLLDPISKNYKTVTCPFIDVLDQHTFMYRAQDEGKRGSWAWNFDYKRLPLLKEDEQHPWQPFDSPIMAGGLFAISRKWFWELGGYDNGLYIWGGEQYEISFKIWMCGGRMIDVPCSRIAHAYRNFFPYTANNHPNSLYINYKRIAEVWLDDYKHALYYRIPALKEISPGDLSEQKAIRENLKCNSFEWYLKNIAFDQIQRYPSKDPMVALLGPVRSNKYPDKCLKIDAQVDTCTNAQSIRYTFRGEIRFNTHCLECSNVLSAYRCHGYYMNQRFLIKWSSAGINNNPVMLQCADNKLCLALDSSGSKLTLQNCDEKNDLNLWNWLNVTYNEASKQWKEWGILEIENAKD